MRNAAVRYIGFDRALKRGLLASYMTMMNMGGSGGYDQNTINKARNCFGTDPFDI